MNTASPLTLIGYWQESAGDGFIDPRQLAPVWRLPRDKELLIRYLRAGVLCGGDLGHSCCRFACGIPDRDMGSAEWSDGVWAWPQGLAHYVEAHDIDIPDAFYRHMAARQFVIDPALHWRDLVGRPMRLDFWRAWCLHRTT